MPTAHGDAGNMAVTNQMLPWHAHTASAVGASHVRDGRSNQDAVGQELAARPDGSPLQIVAVADGHGDARHFRSEQGARMAVAAGIAAVLDWSPAIAGDAGGIRRSAEQALVPDIVARWNAAVAADISEDPFSDAERALLADLGLISETAYGSTLLIAAFTAEYVIFAQIGDGDIVGVLPDGRPLSPVPQDSSLDGWRTTSLCQPEAAAAFRIGVIQLSASPLHAVLAATDGFGNAQADDPWQPGVAADLARFGREHDQGWLARQLPGWAAQCASSDGSGDDTTMALVVNSAVAAAPAAPGGPPGQDMLADDTVPARTLQLPAPDAGLAADGDLPGGDAEREFVHEPARPGRTVRLPSLNRAQLAVAVAVAAAVIAGLVLALLLPGHGQSRPKPGRHSAHKATHQPSPSSSGSATPSPSGSVTPSPSGSAKPSPSGNASPSPSGSAKPGPSGSAKPGRSAGAKADPSAARNTGSPHASGPRRHDGLMRTS